jgi:transposase InsO family protein
LKELIKPIFETHDGDYGSPRITEELKDQGHLVGHNRVGRLMKELELSVEKRPKFKPQTTDSAHGFPIAPNLLAQCFTTAKPNEAWVSDITYIRIGNRWAYLCVIIDLFSRKVVGWSLADHMRTTMVTDALKRAVKLAKPKAGLIFHSDRGVQYASHEFRKALKAHNIVSSMSRKGNCYDNSVAESFFNTIKRERIKKDRYRTIEEAKNQIFYYIEIYYNRVRKHSTIGYKSPVQFERLQAA